MAMPLVQSGKRNRAWRDAPEEDRGRARAHRKILARNDGLGAVDTASADEKRPAMVFWIGYKNAALPLDHRGGGGTAERRCGDFSCDLFWRAGPVAQCLGEFACDLRRPGKTSLVARGPSKC